MFPLALPGGKELGNRVGGKLCLFTELMDEREICAASQHTGPGEVWFSSPGSFPGGKMVQNGAPAGTTTAGARDAFCIIPERSMTAVGPCGVPGDSGKQRSGHRGMGTHGDSLAPWPGDIWPRLVLVSQRFGRRRGSSQAIRAL